MDEAVALAVDAAHEHGDAVLLSPACTSWDCVPRLRPSAATTSPAPCASSKRAHGEDGTRSRAKPQPRPTGGDAARPLLVVIAALCVVGLVMVLSASSVDALRTYGSSWYFFVRQAIYVGLGAVALWVTSRIDYHVWRKFALPSVAGRALPARLRARARSRADRLRRAPVARRRAAAVPAIRAGEARADPVLRRHPRSSPTAARRPDAAVRRRRRRRSSHSCS